MDAAGLAAHVSALGLHLLLILLLVTLVMVTAYLLGERRHGRATEVPFESGIVHVGDPRGRMHTPYFLVAILFVIFDLEAVFIFAWAIAFRESGWAGYLEILFFIGVLTLALVYLWRAGALAWGPQGRHAPRAAPRQGESRAARGIAPPVPAPSREEPL